MAGKDLGQPLTQVVERQQRLGVVAAQQWQRHPIDPGLVQELFWIEALEQGVGGEQGDEGTRRGASDRVDARFLVVCLVEVAHSQRQRGSGARLVGSERSAS